MGLIKSGLVNCFLKLAILAVIFLERVASEIYSPVTHVSAILTPKDTSLARSKLRCVANCEIFADCIAVQYNSTSQECVLLHLATSSCPIEWTASTGSLLIHRNNIQINEILVFRTSGGRGAPFYDPWESDGYQSPCQQTVFDFNEKIDFTYKHPSLRRWSGINMLKVQLQLLKNGDEKVKLVFDGTETTHMNWFEHSRILESSFSDLKDKSGVIMSIEGYGGRRRFYIRKNHATCLLDNGWMVFKEASFNCPWENWPPYPAFIYSTSGKLVTWTLPFAGEVADELLISLIVEV